MVDIVDSDEDDRISQQLSQFDSRSKGKLTLPKRLDHSGIGSSKYFKQDIGRQSPTFSPLNSIDNKNKGKTFIQNSVERRKLPDRGNIKLNQFNYTNDVIGGQIERSRAKYSFSKQNLLLPVPKPHQFSPYNQRGVLRKTRHSLYAAGKQNSNLNSFNYTSSNLKFDSNSFEQTHKIPDIPRIPQLSNQKSQQIIELKNKFKQSQQQNQELKKQLKQLKLQLKQSKDREYTCQKILSTIQRQCRQFDASSVQGVSEFIKKWQRNQALVASIMDMKIKITGKSESNLKDLWRWLKSSIQDLGMKKDIINWLKQDYLRLSIQEPDEMIRLRLIQKGKR